MSRLDAEARATLKALIDARRREAVLETLPPSTFRSKPGHKVKLPQVGTRGTGGVRAVQHGTESAYVNHRCRCEACRDAARLARAIRRVRYERRCGFCGERHCSEHADLEEMVA